MYLIQNITSNPSQAQTLILPNGQQTNLTISYYPQQYAWFIVSLTYGTFTLTGIQITTNPNLLHQWRNQLPFGLACFVSGNREPTQQQDFSSGAAQLYILSAAEVVAYQTHLVSGVTAP
jgi:hypothetical protein